MTSMKACEICRSFPEKDMKREAYPWKFLQPESEIPLAYTPPPIRSCVPCADILEKQNQRLVITARGHMILKDKERKSSSTEGTFSCPICLTDDITLDKQVGCSNPAAAHVCCSDCLEADLKDKYMVDMNRIRCVANDSCSFKMDPSCIDRLSNVLQKRLRDPLLSGTKKSVFCPFCKKNFLVDRHLMGVAQCSECLFPLCIRCGEPSHPGFLCPEDQKKVTETEESLRSAGAARCPRCFTPGFRTEACSTIRCACGCSYFVLVKKPFEK